jgi:2-polyprenyl-6-hydroxyphenyl methylase/3-demethylubiquinone-9 3-methyltransferase
MPSQASISSADAAEVARFAALAERWWDEDGEFRPLHRMNPVRIGYVRQSLLAHFALDGTRTRPLEGLRLLDIGCGGGLLAEPMARLGARVTGLDAAEPNVAVARTHAASMGLDIEYLAGLPEDLAARGRRFDVVLNMEVVEHVADAGAFIEASAGLVEGGGALVAATLNRTLKSLALAKFGAEYVLRWLPPGTHDWRKFVRPSELAGHLRRGGLEVMEFQGAAYNPLRDEWRLSDDLSVNYFARARRAL